MFCRSTRQRGSSSNFLLWTRCSSPSMIKPFKIILIEGTRYISIILMCICSNTSRDVHALTGSRWRMWRRWSKSEAFQETHRVGMRSTDTMRQRRQFLSFIHFHFILLLLRQLVHRLILYFFSSNLSWQPKLAKEILLELNCTCSPGWANTILKLKAFSRL